MALTLTDITPKNLERLTDDELQEVHADLHRQFLRLRGQGRAIENVVNAHLWVVDELERRELDHRSFGGGLDVAKLPMPADKATDLVLIPDYVSVVGSAARIGIEQARDLDILVRENEDVPASYKDTLFLLLRRLFDPDKTGKRLHLLFNPQGPHHGTYAPIFDLVLRPSTGERRIVKTAPLRLTTLGVGAMKSPRYAPAGLLLEYGSVRVMFDGGPGAAPRGDLDAWLVTDEQGELMPKIRKLAEERGVMPNMGFFHRAGLTITPRAVVHTNHPTVGYLIDVHGKKIVWAPEFFEFPDWAAGADIMFAEAAGWNRPIRFAGNVGGHLDALTVAKEAKRLGVKRLVFAHIGRPTIEALDAGRVDELTMGEFGRDGQVYLLRNAALARATLALKAAVAPLAPYGIQKPSMAFWTDFKDVDELWENWAARVVEDRGYVYVSPKIDGLRAILHADGRGKAKVFFADQDEDVSKKVPELVSALTKSPVSLVVEGEFQAKTPQGFLSRSDLASYLAGKLKGQPKVFLYDILYYNDQDIHGEPFEKRIPYLKAAAKYLGSLFVVLPQTRAGSKSELEKKAKAALQFPGPPIEGIVTRDPEMPYTFGATNDYAKTKKYVELKVRVVRVNEKANGWTYTGALAGKQGDVVLGDTFVSAERLADEGDTLNVGIEQLEIKDDGSLAWHKPRPLGVDKSRGPYTVEQAINLARRFGVLTEQVSKACPSCDIQGCSDCLKDVSAGAPAPVKPYGPRDAKLAVIGDGPGAKEREEGKPLVGPTGRFLRTVLAEMGVDEDAVFWGNVYDGTQEFSEETTVELGQKLLRRLDSMPDLKAVVAISLIAAHGLTGVKLDDIDEYRSAAWETPGGIPIIVTYHPAALARTGQRQSRYYPKFRSDLRRAVGIAYGKAVLTTQGVPTTIEQPRRRPAYRPHIWKVEEEPTRGEVAAENWDKNWFDMLPRSGGGRFVVQHHWRGLDEEEAKSLSDDELLDTTHSVHTDLRLEAGDALWGITIFTNAKENREAGGDQLLALKPGGKQLQGTVKLQQPKQWLNVGKDKPYIGEPGGVGSTSKKWSKFFALDWGTYRLGVARKHAVELFFDGRKLSGRYQFVYARDPSGRRFWVLRKPADQEPMAAGGDKVLLEQLLDVKAKRQQGLVWSDGERPQFIPREQFDELIAELKERLSKSDDTYYEMAIAKARPELQYTFGVVYKATKESDSPILDAHGEFALGETLQKAQWDYVRSGNRKIFKQHGLTGDLYPIGEWVDIVSWPFDVEVTLTLPDREPRKATVPAGSIWMGVVWNDAGWRLVKTGQIRGFSMGGFARRKTVAVAED